MKTTTIAIQERSKSLVTFFPRIIRVIDGDEAPMVSGEKR